MLALAGVLGSPDRAGAHGYSFHEISLDIAPGIFEQIRVISSTGQAYSSFADGEIGLGYDLSIEMDQGGVGSWGIYWGECSGNACLDGAAGGTQLIDSRFDSNDPSNVNTSRSMRFPSSAIGATPTVPVGQTNDSTAIVQACNDWLAGGGDITLGTTILYDATITVAVNATPEEDFLNHQQAVPPQPYAFPPATSPDEVDGSATFTLHMPVNCAAYQEPPSAEAPTGVETELPDEDLETVQLALDFSVPSDGAPHEFAGACPVNVNLNMLVGTNIAAPIWVWVEHVDDKGNNWTSPTAQFQVDQITDDGTWKWTRSEPLMVPVNAAAPPQPPAVPFVANGDLVSGGAGNDSGGNDGGGVPSAVVPGVHGDSNRHVGQIKLFAGIGRNVVELLDTDGGTTDVVTYEKILNSGFKTYDVTCEPQVNPVAGDAPGNVQTAAFVEESFLAAVPQATADGNSCGIWANGWVRSNVGNVPITVRLRNQAGDLSGSQTVWTNPDTRTAYLLEFFDFSGSGEGVWVQPGGGWSMPGASNLGNQEGVHEGSYQLVVESPAGHVSNVATYDFTCQSVVQMLTPGVATLIPQAPDGDPSQPQPSRDLSSDPIVQQSLDAPAITSLVLDDASVDPQHGYVNVPLGQDGFWSDGYSGTVTWRVLVGAVINPELQGVATQWTTISAHVGPWSSGMSTTMTPQMLSLSDPPSHEVLQADYVTEFLSSGSNTPEDICNARRQEMLDQGQSLAGVLGNHHIIDITDQELPRAQLSAALAYDEDEDPYSESAIAVLPLRIRCLGNPAIAEQFLPSADAPGGVATPENFNIISAGLSIAFDGQPPVEPATYEGSCPTDGALSWSIAANQSGTAQYQILHLSEANVLTASPLITTAVDQFNNAGYWEFNTTFDPVIFPKEDQILPGFSTEPGGFVTDNFSVPAAGDLIGNNNNDPNVHTGFFRIMASPVGVPEQTADSLWKKYRVTCVPVEGTPGDLVGGSSDIPPRLDITKSGPAECRAGANCPLNVRLRNPEQGQYPGPLSVRVSPNLPGARLASSNWQCVQPDGEISCVAQPDGLASGALTDLQLTVLIPRNAVPGTQFNSCAVVAPPRPEVDPVLFAQFMLTRLGFQPGGIDGRSGPKTRDAVRAFQQANNLQANGVIDQHLVLTLLNVGGPVADQSTETACATVAIARAPNPASPAPPVISTPPPTRQPPPGLSVLPAPGKPQVRPQPQRVVVTCTGGTVRGPQCICPPRWTRQTVRIAPTAHIFNCVPPR